MKAKLFYRIAAVLFVLFAAGHTFGFLKFKPPTPEGIAVRDSMKNVHFRVEGRDYSYGGFYDGFGWYISAYLLFSISGLATRQDRLGWRQCRGRHRMGVLRCPGDRSGP